MFNGIHHAGIGVRDMEKSLKFYRDLLGFEVTQDLPDIEGPLLDEIVGIRGGKVRIVHLDCGNNQELELFQYDKPGSSKFPEDFRQCDGGIIHIAFWVDELMGKYEKLKAAGVRFNSEPYNLGAGLCVYMRDPDGITVEMMQKVETE